MNIKLLLEASYQEARNKPIKKATTRELHQTRSQQWVESLASGFRHYFEGNHTVRVLSKYSTLHRREFGLNELLHDVLVCRVATVKSPQQGRDLYYICDVLWQIESELARNTRGALYDFNKLVLGAAANKLFVGPQVGDRQAFLNTLLPAALVCRNAVYAALIPHPKDWEASQAGVDVWRLAKDQWIPYS